MMVSLRSSMLILTSPFFQLGQGYVFELQCEKFEYSGEVFETGYDQVDDTTIEPDFFRLEFELEEGTDTFLYQEDVIIYNLEGEYDITDGNGDPFNILDGGTAEIVHELTYVAGDANDIRFKEPQDAI